jgi:hypothetical protein
MPAFRTRGLVALERSFSEGRPLLEAAVRSWLLASRVLVGRSQPPCHEYRRLPLTIAPVPLPRRVLTRASQYQ